MLEVRSDCEKQRTMMIAIISLFNPLICYLPFCFTIIIRLVTCSSQKAKHDLLNNRDHELEIAHCDSYDKLLSLEEGLILSYHHIQSSWFEQITQTKDGLISSDCTSVKM